MRRALAPASAASKICARLSLRPACLPPLRSVLRASRSFDQRLHGRRIPRAQRALERLDHVARRPSGPRPAVKVGQRQQTHLGGTAQPPAFAVRTGLQMGGIWRQCRARPY